MYSINIFCYILVHMQNGTLTHASTSYDQQPAKDQASGLHCIRDMLKYYNVNIQFFSLKIPGYNESCTVLQVQRVLAGDWLDSEVSFL